MKKERRKNLKNKKLEKEKSKRKKLIFVKLAQKRSTPKWTNNRMGYAKKGHNKTGCGHSGLAIKSCTHGAPRL